MKQLLQAERRYQELHPSTVAGIPCLVGVIDLYTDTSDGWAGSRSCFKYNILDRRGYRALWLERKATSADAVRFEREIVDIRRAYAD
jgi:hypothetical protein